MTFLATPEPSNLPPRVRLDFDTDDPARSFTTLSVSRDGTLVREQPFAGNQLSLAYDYEAPFGVPVTYQMTGSYLPPVTADWTESWASLASWTGDTGSFSVSGGKARSTVTSAQIVRSATGTIQRLSVADPSYVRIELLTSGDVVVGSVQVDSKITVKGTSTTSTAGSGSFTVSLVNGTMSVAATSLAWSLSRTYTGVPVKVRVVALGVSYPLAWTATSFGGSPESVATDSSGNSYVADYSGQIFKFTTLGVNSLFFPFTGSPGGLAVDGSGNIYVADIDNNRLRKYSSAGVAGLNFSTTGEPQGVAVDGSGNIYVVDYDNARVRKFNSAGTPVLDFAVTGQPYAIALDGSGNIYVTDVTNNRVRKFNSAGTAGITFTTGGYPVGVAVDAAGIIFVLDRDNDRVRKYTTAGVFITDFVSSSQLSGLALDTSGNIFVTDHTFTLRKYTSVTPSVGTIVESPVATAQPFNGSVTVTLDVDEAWLIHPSQPSLSASIDPGANLWRDDGINVAISTKPTVSRGAQATTHFPTGRSRGVTITHGDRLDGAWDLVLYTPTLDDRDAVQLLVTDQTPLLLRTPPTWDWDLPDGFYQVGDVTEARLFPGLQHADRELTLPLQPTDSPVVRQGAVRTWADVLLEVPTWQVLLDSYDTWLDVLAGN